MLENIANVYLNEGDVVLDIGAQVGILTVLFSKMVGCKGKVIAFEPFPENYEALSKALQVNLVNNVTKEKLGVGTQEKSMFFLAKAIIRFNSIARESG